MAKSNIKVSRYVDNQLGWEASISPEDGSWILFVPRQPLTEGGPKRAQLWHRVGTCTDEHGDQHDAYAAEGSDELRAYLSDYGSGVGLTEEHKPVT